MHEKDNQNIGEPTIVKNTVIIFLSLTIATLLFGGNDKISGDTHFRYSFEDADNNAFQLSRAYFTYSKKVNDQVSYKFQTDIGSGGPTDLTVYLKNANLSYESTYGKFVFGLQGMNMFKIQESNWGYRFVEKSILDKNKYSSSADLGISWEKSLGAITPNLMITNGSGYKQAENDRFKKVSLRLLHGQTKLKRGFNAGVVLSLEGKDYDDGTGAIENGNTTVMGGFAAIVAGPIKAGGEFAVKSADLASKTSENVFSIYCDYGVNKMISVFGRFDLVNPDVDTDNDEHSYMILGADYHPGKVFHMAPNVEIKYPESDDAETIYKICFRFKI